MKRESMFHYAAALFLLAVTGLIAFREPTAPDWEPLPPEVATSDTPVSLTGFDGTSIASASYKRIVLLAGANLVERLVSAERIAGVDSKEASNRGSAWAFADTPQIASITNTAAILLLHPDLVIARISTAGERAAAEVLKGAGCGIFDPGEVTNVAQLERCYFSMGALLQARARAQLVIQDLRLRARLLALHGPARATRVFVEAPPSATAVNARLSEALRLAGLSPTDKTDGTIQLALPKGALSDPLGSDIVDVATALRDAGAKQEMQ